MGRVENLKRKRANSRTLQVAQPYESELNAPGFFRAMSFGLRGRFQTSGAGLVALDGPFNFLNEFRVERGDDVLVNVRGVDLRHLTAFFADYHKLEPNLSLVDTSTLGVPWQELLLGGKLDFEAPWMGQEPLPIAVDGTKEKIVVRGNTGVATKLGNTVTNIESKLEVGYEVVPNEHIDEFPDHLEPRYSYTVEELITGTGFAHRATFGGPRLITHVMLRAFDASAELSNANLARSDALIRKVRILHRQKGADDDEILPWTPWLDLRSESHTGYGLAAPRSGVVMISFDDPRTRGVDALKVHTGDEVVIELDTESPTDPSLLIGSPSGDIQDPVVAAGDKLFATWVAYQTAKHPMRLPGRER